MSRRDRSFLPINGEVPHSSINTNGVFLSSSTTLGIIYSLIARAKVILAHYACCHGNFSEVAQQVLQNISLETDSRMSYASGEYMYHYISDDGLVYLCITDDEFERSKAFLFLEDIKNRFEESYKGSIQTALPFAMNSEFSDVLKSEMRHYTNARLSMLPVQKLDNIRVRNLELQGDGQLEQLELLESTDSISVKSFESMLTNPHFKARCLYCLQDHWKPILSVLVILFIVVVILVAVVLGVCLEGEQNKCGT